MQECTRRELKTKEIADLMHNALCAMVNEKEYIKTTTQRVMCIHLMDIILIEVLMTTQTALFQLHRVYHSHPYALAGSKAW